MWHMVPSFDLRHIPLRHYKGRQGNVGIMIVLFKLLQPLAGSEKRLNGYYVPFGCVFITSHVVTLIMPFVLDITESKIM